MNYLGTGSDIASYTSFVPPFPTTGPGGKKLSYMGGDMITKTLNEAFGYDGWCLEVKNTTREEPIKDDKGRYHVAYIATVRITHRHSGVFRGMLC